MSKSRKPSRRAEITPTVADLSELVGRVRETSRQMVRELGFLRGSAHQLSPSQCHSLVEIGRCGTLSGAQLAQVLVLDKSTTSRALAPLVRRRLLRTSVPRADRRSKQYDLTKTGRLHLDKVHTAADTQVGRALSLLSEADRAAAVRGLELYAKALARARRRDGVVVRTLRRTDNPAVAAVIRTVMPEFGASGPGFAILDPEVDDMFGTYKGRAAYFVATREGVLLGGAGVAPLTGARDDVCELRKMYLLADARGLGVGQSLLDTALTAARKLGYRRCYLETLSHMRDARKLYEKNGFTPLKRAMGKTGHFGCNTFYLLAL